MLIIVLADTQMNEGNPFASRGGEGQVGCEVLCSSALPPLGSGPYSDNCFVYHTGALLLE